MLAYELVTHPWAKLECHPCHKQLGLTSVSLVTSSSWMRGSTRRRSFTFHLTSECNSPLCSHSQEELLTLCWYVVHQNSSALLLFARNPHNSHTSNQISCIYYLCFISNAFLQYSHLPLNSILHFVLKGQCCCILGGLWTNASSTHLQVQL